MSQVLARFRLTEASRVSYYIGGETKEATRIKMTAVQGEPFGPATPQGNIDMLIVNPEAARFFNESDINREFSILFTPV